MIYLSSYPSPLGPMVAACDETALIGLWFEDQKYGRDLLKGEVVEKKTPILEETEKWLDLYFSGREPDFLPPLRTGGSPFRREVAEIMRTIPYGKTMTYGEIAREIARDRGLERMSAQAVGGAVGHNPIVIMIPCHRVIGSHGQLTGYAGGLYRKKSLLKLEGVRLEGLKVLSN